MANYNIELDSIEEALKDVQEGKPVILLDNPSREGEGDFIVSAAKVTPEYMNEILLHARGAFIAVFMPEDHANNFNLPAQLPMEMNKESSRTNFRLTVDTKYGHSGCSAAERAQTANILGGVFNPYKIGKIFNYDEANDVENTRPSNPNDLVRPGHVIPIAANSRGLHARQGHTESGVELMKLAGINPPVAVDMEILHPDGTMADPEYIRKLADSFGYKIISIAQICEHLGIEEKFYVPAEKEVKKTDKKIVVYTSGAWDMFHVGHLNLFKRSKMLGDKLVVAVSTDELVASYKEKPVIAYEDRVSMVRSCHYVDKVVKQTNLSDINQIKEIDPDIITVGSDWKDKALDGLDWFKNQPGKKLVYLPYTSRVSSTKIKDVIKDRAKQEIIEKIQ